MSQTDELRELLYHKADEVPPHRAVPPPLIRRARRRIARNVAGLTLALAVLAGGAYTGVRTLGRPIALQPAGRPTTGPSRPAGPSAPPAGPSPTVSPSAGLELCAAADLQVTAKLQGAAGSLVGSLAFTTLSNHRCALRGRPAITLRSPSGVALSGYSVIPVEPWWVVNGSARPTGWPMVSLGPGQVAVVRVRWSNWCGSEPNPAWAVAAPGGGTVEVNLQGLGPPPCNGPGQPSTIEEGPFEPLPGS